jgi:hypothetical protein
MCVYCVMILMTVFCAAEKRIGDGIVECLVFK